MIKLAFFLVKYLFSNKYRVIIAFSSKIDYLCFRVIQLCEVWGIRLIDFRNQFVTHPFLSLILQFVNQRDSLNGNNHNMVITESVIRINFFFCFMGFFGNGEFFVFGACTRNLLSGNPFSVNIPGCGASNGRTVLWRTGGCSIRCRPCPGR